MLNFHLFIRLIILPVSKQEWYSPAAIFIQFRSLIPDIYNGEHATDIFSIPNYPFKFEPNP